MSALCQKQDILRFSKLQLLNYSVNYSVGHQRTDREQSTSYLYLRVRAPYWPSLPYPHRDNFNRKLYFIAQPIIIISGLRDQAQEHE